jgi:hypothetical protein
MEYAFLFYTGKCILFPYPILFLHEQEVFHVYFFVDSWMSCFMGLLISRIKMLKA